MIYGKVLIFVRYTEIYGDGDSKSFNTVKNTYADIEVKN